MAKVFTAILLTTLISSCDNSGTTSETADTTGVNRSAVENVNGNMPETTNSISLDTNDTIVRMNTDTVRQ